MGWGPLSDGSDTYTGSDATTAPCMRAAASRPDDLSLLARVYCKYSGVWATRDESWTCNRCRECCYMRSNQLATARSNISRNALPN